MFYELWDLEPRNLLYDFGSIDEAFDAIRELSALNEGIYPDKLALARVEAESKTTWLARGVALLRMAERRPAV
jgi:hypothetical protein